MIKGSMHQEDAIIINIYVTYRPKIYETKNEQNWIEKWVRKFDTLLSIIGRTNQKSPELYTRLEQYQPNKEL